jgi:hypothetical protein
MKPTLYVVELDVGDGGLPVSYFKAATIEIAEAWMPPFKNYYVYPVTDNELARLPSDLRAKLEALEETTWEDVKQLEAERAWRSLKERTPRMCRQAIDHPQDSGSPSRVPNRAPVTALRLPSRR